MLNIKDMEEKRLIIAYYIARNSKCQLNDDIVWNQWNGRWPKDLRSKNNRPLKRYNHHCVESRTQAKKEAKSENLSYDYTEYDNFIIETCEWVKSLYDKDKANWKNANIVLERLFIYRETCDKRIRELLFESGLAAEGYKLQNQTSKKHPHLLGDYLILHNQNGVNKCVIRGSYEQVMNYLKGVTANE